MITPNFVTPKYCVPFLLVFCLAIVALYKTGELPPSEANLSLFGTTLSITNGKLALTQSAKPLERTLFSIASCTSTRFNVTFLDREIMHACPKWVAWIAPILGFIAIAVLRFFKLQRSA